MTDIKNFRVGDTLTQEDVNSIANKDSLIANYKKDIEKYKPSYTELKEIKVKEKAEADYQARLIKDGFLNEDGSKKAEVKEETKKTFDNQSTVELAEEGEKVEGMVYDSEGNIDLQKTDDEHLNVSQISAKYAGNKN